MADVAIVINHAETDMMSHIADFEALLETIASDSQCLTAKAQDLDIEPDFY